MRIFGRGVERPFDRCMSACLPGEQHVRTIQTVLIEPRTDAACQSVTLGRISLFEECTQRRVHRVSEHVLVAQQREEPPGERFLLESFVERRGVGLVAGSADTRQRLGQFSAESGREWQLQRCRATTTTGELLPHPAFHT